MTRKLAIAVLAGAVIALILTGCYLIEKPLTPQEVAHLLKSQPRTMDDLFALADQESYTSERPYAKRDVEWSRGLAQMSFKLRKKENPSIEKTIHWYGGDNRMNECKFIEGIEAIEIDKYYFAAAAPQEFLIFLDENENILGWLGPRSFAERQKRGQVHLSTNLLTL